MTTTDERRRQHSRDMIAFVRRGRLGAIVKSLIAIAVLTTAFGPFIRYGLAATPACKPKFSAAVPQDAPNDIVRARWPSSCSVAFAPNLILRRTGCEDSRELIQRR